MRLRAAFGTTAVNLSMLSHAALTRADEGVDGDFSGILFTATYEDDTEELLGSIGNTTPDPHSYGIDAAWFWIEPCE